MYDVATEWIKILGPTILLGIGGLIMWILKTKNEELQLIQQKISEERIRLYGTMLEPYVRLLASVNSPKEVEKSVKQIQSFEWQNASTHLILFGSDDVIKAWNRFAQCNYRMGDDPANNTMFDLLKFYGEMLLAIRKDVGNKNTKLNSKETMMWKIKDIEAVFNQNNK